MHSPSLIWTRWRRVRPGSCALVWSRWSHSVTARGSRAAVRSRLVPGGAAARCRTLLVGRCRDRVAWGDGTGWAAVSVRWAGAPAGCRSAGAFGPLAVAALAGFGAAVGGGVPVFVGDGDAPGGGGAGGGVGGHGAGEIGVDGAERGGLPGVAGEAEQGGQRDGQVDRCRWRRPGPGAGGGVTGAGGVRGRAARAAGAVRAGGAVPARCIAAPGAAASAVRAC